MVAISAAPTGTVQGAARRVASSTVANGILRNNTKSSAAVMSHAAARPMRLSIVLPSPPGASRRGRGGGGARGGTGRSRRRGGVDGSRRRRGRREQLHGDLHLGARRDLDEPLRGDVARSRDDEPV